MAGHNSDRSLKVVAMETIPITEAKARIAELADVGQTHPVGNRHPGDGRRLLLGKDAAKAKSREAVREYERLRAETTWILVAAGHEPPEIARVVDARGGFTIVEVR